MEKTRKEVHIIMKIVDFSKCELSNRNLEYAGRAGEKRGIIYNGEMWFLKFPKNTVGMSKVSGLSYVTSPLSEFIGSSIYKLLGYDVHETILGICNDGKRYKVVCACKDFIKDAKNELLIPYTALRNDTNPVVMERNNQSIQSASNINGIIFQLSHNTILSKIVNAEERFWDVVIIDMLINNNDRNEDNWGVIRFRKEETYKMAPIYDCGNCFYGKTSDERIIEMLSDNDRLVSSAINGITAYEDDDEKRIPITKILAIVNQNNKESIFRVYSRINENMDKIKSLINDIPTEYNGIEIMSNARKEYYLKTIDIRIEQLLKKYL